jgi:hypothetical protein
MSTPRWLSGLGEPSYSLYAVHLPIVELTLVLGRGAAPGALRWIGLAAVGLTTELAFRFLLSDEEFVRLASEHGVSLGLSEVRAEDGKLHHKGSPARVRGIHGRPVPYRAPDA